MSRARFWGSVPLFEVSASNDAECGKRTIIGPCYRRGMVPQRIDGRRTFGLW